MIEQICFWFIVALLSQAEGKACELIYFVFSVWLLNQRAEELAGYFLAGIDDDGVVSLTCIDDDDGVVSLNRAAYKGDVPVVKALLEAKVAPDQTLHTEREGVFCSTALMAAATQGHPEVAKLLLAAKADADKKATNLGSFTPLFQAARMGNRDMVDLLLQAKADLNAVDGVGESAFVKAVIAGHIEIAKLLLEAGAERAEPARLGLSLIAGAVYYGLGPARARAVQFLLEAKTSADDVGLRVVTPLLCAVRHEDCVVVQLLLDAKADSNRHSKHVFPNPDSHTDLKFSPLIGAVAADGAMLTALLQAKADVNATGFSNRSWNVSRRTAYKEALDQRNPEAARLLLEAKAGLEHTQPRLGR
jgi:uncharacterized protein